MAKASQVVLLENEFYLIKAPNGKVLEIKNFNTENGAAIRLWDYAGHPWQQWQFVDAGEGRWRIRNRFTGKFIDLALGGVVGSWLVGVIDDAIGTKKTMVMFGIWYALALLLNFTAVDSVTPLVYVSLFMIAMGIGGSANFTTSLTTSVFGRQGFSKVNSVVFPIQGAVSALSFVVNGVVSNITGGNLRYTYLIFAGVSVVSALIVLLVDEHRFNKDWQQGQNARSAS